MREFDGGRKDNYPTAHKDAVARDQWNMVVKRLRRTGGWSFDDQPHLLGLPSGRVVDLRTGVPRDAVKKDRVIMTVAKTPEEADTPHFDRFLDQVTCGRQDSPTTCGG